jgi:hypothetical protein
MDWRFGITKIINQKIIVNGQLYDLFIINFARDLRYEDQSLPHPVIESERGNLKLS